jgi:hypothetical protein
LHFPDFSTPDFTQPTLERADLAQPGFVLPDVALSQLQKAHQLPLWPEEMARPPEGRPDPALPDLLEPERSGALSYPSEETHLLPEPENAPEVVMQQRPAELDPASLALTLTSPDSAGLPPGLTYPQLYTDDEEMTRRKRRFALRELGLQDNVGNSYAD